MEFVINHTRRQIREFTNVSETDVDACMNLYGWEDTDDAEVVTLKDDSEEEWDTITRLIVDADYDIPEVFLELFVPDQTRMSEEYDAQPEEDPTDEFQGWDTPGAAFDW